MTELTYWPASDCFGIVTPANYACGAYVVIEQQEDEWVVVADLPDQGVYLPVPLPPPGLKMTKAVAKAWLAATDDARFWFKYWGPHTNPDKAVKWLSAVELVTCVSESELFVALGQEVLFRMMQVTTFKWAGEVYNVEAYMIDDSSRMYARLLELGVVPELGRVRCWAALHGDLNKLLVEAEPEYKLVVDDRIEAVDGLSQDNWRLVVPRTSTVLKDWGKLLDHCVGGYGSYVNSGGCYILGVEVDGAMTYTIELQIDRDWGDCYINQFFGRSNSAADPTIQASVTAALDARGLLAE